MANTPPRHPDHDDAYAGHPSPDGTARFPDDARLRRAGYTILRRPRRGPVLWRDPRGRPVAQAEALARVELQGQGEAA